MATRAYKTTGSVRHQKGFTLIELMIVVSIIGILASVAVPTFARYINNAREAEAVELLYMGYRDEQRVFQIHRRYTEVLSASNSNSSTLPALDVRIASKPKFNLITGNMDGLVGSIYTNAKFSFDELPGNEHLEPRLNTFGFSMHNGSLDPTKFLLGVEGDIDSDDFMHVMAVSEQGHLMVLCDDNSNTITSAATDVYLPKSDLMINCEP